MPDVTCITPTFAERAPFLRLCRKYVGRFTLQPREHLVEEGNSMHDNVRKLLAGVRTEYVAFIEDDDWYHPDYLADIVDRLDFSGRMMIGYDPTVYYHIKMKKYRILQHSGRASLFTTVALTSFAQMVYARIGGHKPMIDLAMWKMAGGTGVTTVGRLAIGIKHGLTRSAGHGHHVSSTHGAAEDPDMAVLRGWIGPEDAETYRRIVDGTAV